jgi:uncharacterized protein YndB with AHSA1/START domain
MAKANWRRRLIVLTDRADFEQHALAHFSYLGNVTITGTKRVDGGVLVKLAHVSFPPFQEASGYSIPIVDITDTDIRN